MRRRPAFPSTPATRVAVKEEFDAATVAYQASKLALQEAEAALVPAEQRVVDLFRELYREMVGGDLDADLRRLPRCAVLVELRPGAGWQTGLTGRANAT